MRLLGNGPKELLPNSQSAGCASGDRRRSSAAMDACLQGRKHLVSGDEITTRLIAPESAACPLGGVTVDQIHPAEPQLAEQLTPNPSPGAGRHACCHPGARTYRKPWHPDQSRKHSDRRHGSPFILLQRNIAQQPRTTSALRRIRDEWTAAHGQLLRWLRAEDSAHHIQSRCARSRRRSFTSALRP